MGKLFKKKEGGRPLLQKLTKKVEGGRPMVNFLKGVGDKFTGGMVSKLLPPPTKEDVDRQTARRNKGAKTPEAEPTETTKSVETVQTNSNPNVLPQTEKVKMLDKIKQFKTDSPKGFWGIVIGVIAIVGGIIYKKVKANKTTVKKF